jgi:hypothetical protein
VSAFRSVVAAVALAAALGTAGCGRGADRAAVDTAGERFVAALQSDDGEQACAQLSPDTRAQLESEEQSPCREAITELPLEEGSVTRVSVYVASAAIEFSSGETAFATQLDEGWRLSAVGCTPKPSEPEGPYDCELEG